MTKGKYKPTMVNSIEGLFKLRKASYIPKIDRPRGKNQPRRSIGYWLLKKEWGIE